MKQLLLARHAKSNWDAGGLPDHDRPLNERGRDNLPPMGRTLVRRDIRPALVVSSPAVRARTTAEGLCREWHGDLEAITLVPELYLASPDVILRTIQQLDEAVPSALLVGHNPGMHEAADRLAGSSRVDVFPTLAIARFELGVDFWGEVDWGCGRLVELLTPKALDPRAEG